MIEEYLKSWVKFQAYCETRAKGRALINSDGWKKLADFHLEDYLKKQENPYLFLFTVKMERRDIYEVHRMDKWYRFYCRKRFELLNPLIHGNFHYHR
jgi:hypothetical protein